MDYKIIEVTPDKIEEAMALVKHVFLEVDASDYPEEGIQQVLDDMIENDEFKQHFQNGEQLMLGAVYADKIIGVVATDKNNHISLCFVNPNYHRKGIAKALFIELFKRLRNVAAKQITLNSTPYAVGFYEKIGFIQNGNRIFKHGVLYAPMTYNLEKNTY